MNDETGGRGGNEHAGKQLRTRAILGTLARERGMEQRGQREEKRGGYLRREVVVVAAAGTGGCCTWSWRHEVTHSRVALLPSLLCTRHS